MAYHIDFSQLKLITDDTPQLKREPPIIFAKKESTDYFDANSTICECNEDVQPYQFSLRFKLELKQEPSQQIQEDKEFCNMGSSFGINDDHNDNQSDKAFDNINTQISTQINPNNSLEDAKSNFNQIQKRNVYVQTNKQFLINQQQLFKPNQKYINHAVYQETLQSLKQKQSFQKFVSKKKNHHRSINLLLLLILFIILIMFL